MLFEIKNRWTTKVMLTCDIECGVNTPISTKLALAVKFALKIDANLSSADLRGANLSSANLYGANLSSADLYGANLYGANLYGADLSSADLRGANLSSADLRGANLSSADLSSADLRGADLRGANGIEKQPPQTVILPEGDLVVYKKLREGVAKLLIPSTAKRSNATGRKCRAEFAVVLELPKGVIVGHSSHDPSFEYKAGERVTPDNWDENWAKECASGIHFFITRAEAEQY